MALIQRGTLPPSNRRVVAGRMLSRSGFDGLGLSFSDLFKNPAVTAAIAGGAGIAAGALGVKYAPQIGSGIKTAATSIWDVVKAPVQYFVDKKTANDTRIATERAAYGGHQISWWTERGLQPGDNAGLARWRAAQAAVAAGATGARIVSDPTVARLVKSFSGQPTTTASAATAAKVLSSNPLFASQISTLSSLFGGAKPATPAAAEAAAKASAGAEAMNSQFTPTVNGAVGARLADMFDGGSYPVNQIPPEGGRDSRAAIAAAAGGIGVGTLAAVGIGLYLLTRKRGRK